MKYSFKCVIPSCQKTGDRGFFGFNNARRAGALGQWLTALNMEAVPFASARVCFRHFQHPSDFYMCPTRNRPVLRSGKQNMNLKMVIIVLEDYRCTSCMWWNLRSVSLDRLHMNFSNIDL